MDKKRLARWLVLAAVLMVALVFARQWPRDQTVHYVLGDSAALVTQLDARWAGGAVATDEDWTRVASFRYAPGKAPRIVTHELRLPDGDYTVEIEIHAAEALKDAAHAPEEGDVTVRRHVTLSGGATSIQLAEPVQR
jgi:hypothetical protein